MCSNIHIFLFSVQLHNYAKIIFCLKQYRLKLYLNLLFLFSAALEVELSDDSFPPEDFGIVSGMLNVKWDRIAPYPFKSVLKHSPLINNHCPLNHPHLHIHIQLNGTVAF